MMAEHKRRQLERGKKRFEEDYSFVNQEFFSSWKNRTSNQYKSSQKNEHDCEKMFDGSDLAADLTLIF